MIPRGILLGIRRYKQALIWLFVFAAVLLLLRHRRSSPSHQEEDNQHGNGEQQEVEEQRSPGSMEQFNRKDCLPERLAVIVPFRERFNQLLAFAPHMDAFLGRQKVCYEFFIMNQIDGYRFNRGQLINIGFKLASNRSHYLAIHDVDLLPLNDQLSYRFPFEGDGVFHVSAPALHPKYHYDKFIGGIVILRNTVFSQVNGFSNVYFGYELEDTEIYTRLTDAGFKVSVLSFSSCSVTSLSLLIIF